MRDPALRRAQVSSESGTVMQGAEQAESSTQCQHGARHPLGWRQSSGLPGNAALAQRRPAVDPSSPSACFVLLLPGFPLETLPALRRTQLALQQPRALQQKATSDQHSGSFSQHRLHQSGFIARYWLEGEALSRRWLQTQVHELAWVMMPAASHGR